MSCLLVTPELYTAPTEEPVSLAELKLHLRVDADDDNDIITSLGIAARQWFENALDKQLVTATWRIKLPTFPSWEIELPYPPLRSITSITYKDSDLDPQTLSSSTYDVITWQTPGMIRPKDGYSWPATGIAPDAVTILFAAGYGAAAAVPDLAKAGIKLLAAAWYENREAISEMDMKPVPMAVDSIVASLRAYRF